MALVEPGMIGESESPHSASFMRATLDAKSIPLFYELLLDSGNANQLGSTL